MAQTIIAVLPPMLAFVLAQPFYIQGVVVSGVKLLAERPEELD